MALSYNPDSNFVMGQFVVTNTTVAPDTTTAVARVTFPDQIDQKPFVNLCARDGHVVVGERVTDDGSIAGLCERCGDRIVGRRQAGGLPFARMNALILLMMEDGVDGETLTLLQELDDQIADEQRAIDEARRLLAIGRDMVRARLSGDWDDRRS